MRSIKLLKRSGVMAAVLVAGFSGLAPAAQAAPMVPADDDPFSALVVVSADTNDTIYICRSWGSRSGDTA